MAITITGPLATPVVALNLVAGGSLDPNKTYYIRVVAVYKGSYYSSYQYDSRQSEPSVEQNIMTNPGNQSIQVNWAVIPGADGYDIYISETSGDYKASDFPRCAPNGYWTKTINGGGVVTYTITEMPSHSGNNRGCAFHTMCTEREFPLNQELGTITVNFDGIVTLQDITNAIVAAGYPNYVYYDGINFIIKGSIWITGANAGSLTCYNKNIILLQGSLRNENSNVTLQFGNISGSRYYDGCNFSMCGRNDIYVENNDKFYDCNFKWPATYSSGLGFGTAEGCIWGVYAGSLYVYNENIIQFSLNLSLQLNAEISDFTALKDGDHCIALQQAFDFSNFVYKNGYLTVNTYNATLRDFKHENFSFIDFSMNGVGPGTFKIYNANLYLASNYPKVWWRASTTVVINSYYAVDLKIIDIAGNNIIGATIELKDKDGTVVWSDTSNASGEASEDILALITSNDPAGGAYDSVYDVRSPFTLSVYMDGYQKYRQIFDLEEKTSWIITLKPSSINVDAEQLCDIH